MNTVRRLGLNQGGYLGERIDIRARLSEIVEAADAHGWVCDDLDPGSGEPLLALRRQVSGVPRRRIYLSAGIHGDEPAGPLAIHELLRANRWDNETELWVCPCLNPAGFATGSRLNAAGVDLNRDYRDLRSAEVRAHVAWLEQQPHFDCALCLHEDWEAQGFYVYALARSRGVEIARRMVAAVAKQFPIDSSTVIDGWAAEHGIIVPAPEVETRREWAEALYLHAHKTSVCCTLETPSDFPLAARVAALITGVCAALDG